MSKPLFTIIAGSNGAGKSTLTSLVRDKFQQIPILDPDAISRTLQNAEHSCQRIFRNRSGQAVILDNSGDKYILVGVKQAGITEWNEPVPSWVESVRETSEPI